MGADGVVVTETFGVSVAELQARMDVPAAPAATRTEAPVVAEEFVQSLARGLQVITAFSGDRPRMSLSEVAVATGLSRASARRFLHTLVELGYVRTDGKQFELTPHVLRLGTAYLSGLGLPQLAQPHLERLSAEVGESTSAAVLDGTDIVYVARVSTRRIMTVGITVGTRFPAFATSMGRVLLAYQGAAELDAYFLTADLRPPTPRTVHTESRAATAAGRSLSPGLGRGGFRAGGRSVLPRRSDPGRRRGRGGGDQRVDHRR